MNYVIEEVEGKLGLVEETTGHIVDYFDDKVEAKRKSKFMSSGGAFNGFTPRFICRDHYSNWFEPEFTVQEELKASEASDSHLDQEFEGFLLEGRQ